MNNKYTFDLRQYIYFLLFSTMLPLTLYCQMMPYGNVSTFGTVEFNDALVMFNYNLNWRKSNFQPFHIDPNLIGCSEHSLMGGWKGWIFKIKVLGRCKWFFANNRNTKTLETQKVSVFFVYTINIGSIKINPKLAKIFNIS